MDVLAGHIEFQRAGVQIIQNALQTVNQLVGFLLSDNALRPQHGGVGHGAGDILPVHSAIEADGRIEIVRNAVRCAGGPPGPHLFHNLSSFSSV